MKLWPCEIEVEKRGDSWRVVIRGWVISLVIAGFAAMIAYLHLT